MAREQYQWFGRVQPELVGGMGGVDPVADRESESSLHFRIATLSYACCDYRACFQVQCDYSCSFTLSFLGYKDVNTDSRLEMLRNTSPRSRSVSRTRSICPSRLR